MWGTTDDPDDSCDVPRRVIAMWIMKERRPAMGKVEFDRDRRDPRMRGAWLDEDRSDPYAGQRALLVAKQDPPLGVSSKQAVAAVRDVLDTIGDTCPECPDE